MTPQEINIAIAEHCGWKGPKHPDTMAATAEWTSQSWGVWCMHPGGYITNAAHIPNYHDSLDAMHEAIINLRFSLKIRFMANLQWVMSAPLEDGAKFHEGWLIVGSAAQQSEAFLRTIGKWEDEA